MGNQNKVIKTEDLINFASSILERKGMSKEFARETAEILTLTDSFGINSHGTKNLKGYLEKIKLNALDPTAVPS